MAHRFAAEVPEFAAALSGVLLLLGLGTPIAGITLALSAVWDILYGREDRCVAVFLGTVGVTLAMIGPGAWSSDALIFGRKRIRGASV